MKLNGKMSNINRTYLIERIILIIIVFTIMQDFVLAILLNCGVSASALKMVYYLKEAIILLIGMYVFSIYLSRQYLKISRQYYILALYIVDIVIYYFVGVVNIGFKNSTIGVRQYVIPLCMLIIGIFIGRRMDLKAFNILEKNLYYLSVFLIITTIIERFFVSVDFWKSVNIVRFEAMVKSNSGVYTQSGNTLIQNMYTSGVRRAIGVAANPLLLSYFIIPLLFYFFSKALFERKNMNRNILFTILIFICQILTLTRAVLISELLAIMIFCVVMIICNHTIYNLNIWKLFIALAVIGAILFGDKIYNMIYATLNNLDGGSAGMHMYQFKIGMQNIIDKWYGMGTGSGSNLVAFLGTSNKTTEFAYSNITLDLGIIGTILYILLNIDLCKKFIKGIDYCKNNTKERVLYLTSFLSIVSWLISGFFSPQMWSMKSVLLSWLLYGIALAFIERSKNEKKDMGNTISRFTTSTFE